MPPVGNKKKKTTSTVREILYPKVVLSESPHQITVDKAKELLGWQTEESTDTHFADWAILDFDKKPIRFTNNINNRFIYTASLSMLTQEILNKRWAMNGEPIIIGKTGLVLNGQHSLISLIMAEQERLSSDHWKGVNPEPLSITKVIVYGIEENDSVVNTMDTCKPRSLTDVIGRSEYFATLVTKDRKAVSRIADYAIKLLWHRTGLVSDAYSPIRTHSEATDFINRHMKILKAVKHIFEEDQEDKIRKYISPGTAAGLLYLMAASKTDQEKYSNAAIPSEKICDMSCWEKAMEFWTLFAAGGEELREVRKALGNLMSEDTGAGGTRDEKLSILCKGWNNYIQGKTITAKSLELDYITDDDDIRHLLTIVDVGGIDVGGKVQKVNPDEAVSEETVKARAAEVKKEKLGAKADPGHGTSALGIKDQLAELAKSHPGLLFIIKARSGGYTAYDDYARKIAEAVPGVKAKKDANGIDKIGFLESDLAGNLALIRIKGHKPAIVTTDHDTGEITVTEAKVARHLPKPNEEPKVEEPKPASKPVPAKKAPPVIGKKEKLKGGL